MTWLEIAVAWLVVMDLLGIVGAFIFGPRIVAALRDAIHAEIEVTVRNEAGVMVRATTQEILAMERMRRGL